MNRLVWTVVTLVCAISGRAQIDTEFWFAPPEITSGHGDRPVFLRLSTMDKAAVVRVTQPARNNAVLAMINIPANSTATADLTGNIQLLEPANPASVQKNGIKITASAPITVYYEVAAPFNTDIFALKGKNALGNRFVIAGQNFYSNSLAYSPTPFFSFDIVATRNNTVVKIKPTREIFGHGTAEFTIKLNAGETYSLRKNTVSAAGNPLGTVVESNKPIAVTLKDDSVILLGCRDMLGDQLVPVEVAGTEYVVPKGFLIGGQPEFAFVTGIENETNVHVSEFQQPFNIQAGEVVRVPITAASHYIRSSKPVYVVHVTGFGCELGLAVLPSINCRGSLQIGFTRSTPEFFGLNILVRKGGIGHFTLNGSTTLIASASFRAVPGTNDVWYAAQLNFPTSQVPVGAGSLISNSSHSFQIGLINGAETSSCRYGYFSAFSTLFIGDDFNMCEGETARLDAGLNKDTYLWSTGATTQTIEIREAGTYWVTTESQGCVLTDTIRVGLKKGSINLGPDVAVCEGAEAVVDGKENFSWLWSNGAVDRHLKTTTPGTYWVSVFDYVGCQASDTIVISALPKPVIDLGADVVKCPEALALFDVTLTGASYLWDNGSTAPQRTVQQAGTYWCRVTRNGCSSMDTVRIRNLPGPTQQKIAGSETVCPLVRGVEYSVDAIPGSTYDWAAVGGTMASENGATLTIDWGAANNQAQVSVVITDADGCVKRLDYPVRVNRELAPALPAGPDKLCLNLSNHVLYTTSATQGSTYRWLIDGGTITNGQGTPRVQVDWGAGLNTLRVTETSITPDTVCSGVSEALAVFVYKDPTSIKLNYATIHAVDESQIDLGWAVQHPEEINPQGITLLKTVDESGDWILQELPTTALSHSDLGNFPDAHRYSYKVSFTSTCRQLRESAVHSVVQLRGEAGNEGDQVRLGWSSYEGWPNGVDRYEVWAKLDDEEFRVVSTFPGAETQAEFPSSTAFHHRYRVRAVEKGGTGTSLSNSIEFSFNHEVVVPNVITPNGDAVNQFFAVRNIHLFPENHLLIIDRWGKKVFEAHGYQNTWDAKNQESGVYYFSLTLARNRQVIRGTISVLR